MNELVTNTFLEKAAGRKTVCFTVTVSHAKNLADSFRRLGVASEVVSGDMPQSEREDLLRRFQRGENQVLTNCQILTEGWDCPEVNCVLIAKPTKSRGLYQQIAGRGLRLFPNKKDCLILDFGSTTHSLCAVASLVEDTEHEEIKKYRDDSQMSEFEESSTFHKQKTKVGNDRIRLTRRFFYMAKRRSFFFSQRNWRNDSQDIPNSRQPI